MEESPDITPSHHLFKLRTCSPPSPRSPEHVQEALRNLGRPHVLRNPASPPTTFVCSLLIVSAHTSAVFDPSSRFSGAPHICPPLLPLGPSDTPLAPPSSTPISSRLTVFIGYDQRPAFISSVPSPQSPFLEFD